MKLALAIFVFSATALADVRPPRPLAGFKVLGHSKVTERTVGYLAHVHVGDPISEADLPLVKEALISSELFETVEVALDDTPDGRAILVATVEDKLSWIVGPTVYLTPPNRAIGLGFAENDFGGRDQKLLLYGQLGTQTSIFFATFLDPSYHGTKLQYRIDVYLERKQIEELANPPGDNSNQDVARSTEQTFLDAGFLIGWQFKWWLVADTRLRGAYVYFRNPVDPRTNTPAAMPEHDGWDVTLQTRLTLDHRIHNFGVTRGLFAQIVFEPSVPGWDDYHYINGYTRLYYSWVFFAEHQLEFRWLTYYGYNMPLHEDNALGGVGDLRGYPTDQFRGDFNLVLRGEYSVPLFKWWKFAFRALAFYDSGYATFQFPAADRNYLPYQLNRSFFRNDIGAGFRVYVKAVVLPLLGLDYGYGLESRGHEIYFELGLTDF